MVTEADRYKERLPIGRYLLLGPKHGDQVAGDRHEGKPSYEDNEGLQVHAF